MKNNELKKCPRCQELKPVPEVRERVDPFMKEIYNETIEIIMCEDCEHIRLMDI